MLKGIGGCLLLFLFFLPVLFPSCASIGSPTGGDYDTIPPVFIRSRPAPNSTRFSGNRIELFFNEYINLEKPSEKIIITPPQSKMPLIRSIGKRVVVELKDPLIDSTTYTLDFTNAIVDNNEKNAIEGFTFAFSTGDVIDSLVISGLLLNAENLEPMPNIMVGLHSNFADSTFTTLPFIRTSMTNDKGQFWIRNIAAGTYKLYALNDQNRNFKFDQISEDIAFHDSPITPDFIFDIRMDTVRIDSVTIDTINETRYTRFIPDDIILFLFKEQDKKQFLSKTERPMEHQLVFRFNSPQETIPQLNLLDSYILDSGSGKWFIPEYSSDKRDITLWITDSLIFKQDTINIEASYLITDSLDNLIQFTDTIHFAWRNREAAKKDNQKETEDKIDFLNINLTTKSQMDVFDTLKITFSEPIVDFDFDKIRIEQKIDTLWEIRKFPIVVDTLNPRYFWIDHQWPYEQEYRISIDSATIFSIYGLWNDSIGSRFRFNSEKEYGNLYVIITGSEGPGFGELLDNSERVIRKSILNEDNELVFEDLKPGNYFLRYIEDTNGNGIWDTGNYAENRQPEKVYYYNATLTVTKYGGLEQEWDIRQIPIDQQKPLDITKNKPAVRQQPRRNEQREQGRQQPSGQSSNPFGRSIPGMGSREMPRTR